MNLRTARKLKNLTLTEAGKELGIDAGNLSRIERGAQSPGIELARRIAAFYGMTLDQVFANKPDEPEKPDDMDRDRTTAGATGVAAGKAICTEAADVGRKTSKTETDNGDSGDDLDAVA